MAEKKAKAEQTEEPKAPDAPKWDPFAPTGNSKTIDERMADLLKDHQAMGARPK